MLFAVVDAGISPVVAPWANLAAVTVIVCLFVWYLTRHLPAKDRRNEDRADAKDLMFLNALAAERERSRESAASGHKAAQVLASNIDEMTTEIRRMNDARFAHSRD